MVGVATTVWLIVGSLLICGLLAWAAWHLYKENKGLKEAMDAAMLAQKTNPSDKGAVSSTKKKKGGSSFSPDPMQLY